MTITIFADKPILENLVRFLNWGDHEEFIEEGNNIRGRWHLHPEMDTVQVSVSYDEYIMLADNE